RAGKIVERPPEQLSRCPVGRQHLTVEARHHHRVRECGDDLRGHAHRVDRPAGDRRLGGVGSPRPARRRYAPTLTHESYEATITSSIRAILSTAEALTPRDASPLR